MITPHVALIIICCCTCVFTLEYDNICHYNYNYKCASQLNKHVTTYTDKFKLCTAEHVPKDVNFNIMSDEKNSSSRGIINVDFKSPNIECKYKVSLFINSRINNLEDCKNYIFHQDNDTEIHTSEKTICPINENDTKEGEQETEIMESSSCKDILNMWYEYIYTGCYSLGFKVGEDYIFVGNEFLKTEHKKVEVTEPKLTCTYKSTLKENEPSVEKATITTTISLLAGSSAVKLEIARNLINNLENEDYACNRYSDNPLVSLVLGMSVDNYTDAVDNSCSLSTNMLSTGELAKSIECNYVVSNSLEDTGYCFLVRILDERCHKNTSWKPPLNDKVPCAWTQYCHSTDNKIITSTEKSVDNGNKEEIPWIYVVMFVTLTLVVIAMSSTVFCACHKHVQRKKISTLNGKMKIEDIEDNTSAVLELGDFQSQKEKLVKESKIVILYVRESDQFMSFMAQFRGSLKQHTGCEIYDWWAPELWNDVARLGGYDWVIKLIRKDCRIVWIDTLKARTLFATNNKNGYNRFKQLKRSDNHLEISDFRESVFPAIVDFAKRNNQDIEQEYQRHFVVRLETFKDADKTEDPFADLSPHARYLIPCHLDKLCCQLSILDVNFEEEINVDKVNLGRQLFHEPIVNV